MMQVVIVGGVNNMIVWRLYRLSTKAGSVSSLVS